MAEEITRYTITNLEEVGGGLQQIADKFKKNPEIGMATVGFFVLLQNYLLDREEVPEKVRASLKNIVDDLEEADKEIIKNMKYSAKGGGKRSRKSKRRKSKRKKRKSKTRRRRR